MKRRIPPLPIRLEGDAEQIRRNHDDRIAQLVAQPATSLAPLGEFSFPNATEVVIPHRLGRVPAMFFVSPVIGASSSGRLEEVRSQSLDRAKFLVIKATGFGATVTALVAVM